MIRASLLLFPFLLLAGCGPEPAEEAWHDAPLRACGVTLQVHVAGAPEVVEVAGRFNEWALQPLVEVGEGTWERYLGNLRPGTYGWALALDGAWQPPPPDRPTTWDGDVENRALIVRDCQQPDLETLEATASPTGDLEARFRFTRAADGAPLDPDTVAVTVGGRPAEDLGATVDLQRAEGMITVRASGLAPGKHSVRVSAEDIEGRGPEQGDAFVPLWVEAAPFDWQSGVLYYVFLDRFRDAGGDFAPIPGTEVDGTNYLGGDLVGARQALEEGWFDDLGVTSIWLSPVYENPEAAYPGVAGGMYTGYHGYWPIAPRSVEPRLGTDTVSGDEALHDFVAAAHDRGIRVMLDLVLNHVHEDHPYVEALGLGEEPCVCTTEPGPCNWDTNPTACWFTDYLPNLDYRDQAAVDQMVADVEWWLETYDIDGFRIDAAKHMHHVILRTLSLRLRERYEAPGGAPFYLVGETWVGAGGQGVIMDYVAPYELDGQFDFPLLYPLREAVGLEAGFPVLAQEVGASDAAYGASVHWMSPFLGNHDIERYATYISGCDHWQLFGGCTDMLATEGDRAAEIAEKLALSWAFVVTQPGVPLLYYGDEIGLAGAGDPDNRREMPWGDELSGTQEDLLARFQDLALARRALPALQVGDRQELWVDPDLYVYGRWASGLDPALVVLHMGEGPREVSFWVPPSYDLGGRVLVDALGSEITGEVSEGELQLTIPPWSYAVLVP